jgi:hypothetical protein
MFSMIGVVGAAAASAHRPRSTRERNVRPGRFCEMLVFRAAGSRSSNASQVAVCAPRRILSAFLSICRHATLNFDVMREFHAAIASRMG